MAKRTQTAKQRAASLKNLEKARASKKAVKARLANLEKARAASLKSAKAMQARLNNLAKARLAASKSARVAEARRKNLDKARAARKKTINKFTHGRYQRVTPTQRVTRYDFTPVPNAGFDRRQRPLIRLQTALNRARRVTIRRRV